MAERDDLLAVGLHAAFDDDAPALGPAAAELIDAGAGDLVGTARTVFSGTSDSNMAQR